ncbi:hypothetical protein [Porphyrobacter sp. AAP60]|uniref:hypothetical protein n=1 Tax=Porphyrobacter sp. AAP60 TaxID=1523423 RepID=UPI0006CC847D|nr:hypothetical protein [Porphyrobacter sp. AAP60]KPF63541.1 hypothetical protein IP79_06320 [Porphyrobacter sp. AAP60]
MPASSQDGSSWLDPKWFVAGFALVVFGLIITYDVRLGLAAGALLAAAGFVWLYLALRYAPHNAAESGRSVLVERVRQQASNRRLAAAQMARVAPLPVPAPVAAVMPSGPQQGPNSPQRP